jgi:DNA polymerase sigma
MGLTRDRDGELLAHLHLGVPMPSFTDTDDLKERLAQTYAIVLEIKDVVLDLQTRQKTMDARQQAIKEEIKDAPAMKPIGSFATGYQKPE